MRKEDLRPLLVAPRVLQRVTVNLELELGMIRVMQEGYNSRCKVVNRVMGNNNNNNQLNCSPRAWSLEVLLPHQRRAGTLRLPGVPNRVRREGMRIKRHLAWSEVERLSIRLQGNKQGWEE